MDVFVSADQENRTSPRSKIIAEYGANEAGQLIRVAMMSNLTEESGLGKIARRVYIKYSTKFLEAPRFV
jgi:hypothetical protein